MLIFGPSQLAEPLWTDPGLKSGTVSHEPIFTVKKKKKSAGRKWHVEPSCQFLACKENATKPSKKDPLKKHNTTPDINQFYDMPFVCQGVSRDRTIVHIDPMIQCQAR